MKKIIDGILDYIGHAIGKCFWVIIILAILAIIGYCIK